MDPEPTEGTVEEPVAPVVETEEEKPTEEKEDGKGE